MVNMPPKQWVKRRLFKQGSIGFDSHISIVKTLLPPEARQSAEASKKAHRLDMFFAYGVSLLLHVVLPIGLAVVAFIVTMVWHLMPFSKQAPVVATRDLEFVLVPPNQPAQKPLDLHTQNRSTQNSRAGGKSDPTHAINLTKQNITAPVVAVKPMPPKTTSKPIPPKIGAIEQPVAPPSAKTSDNTVQPESAEAANNPQQGNPNAPDGVDALKQSDVGPYMKDLQQRIRETWHPPRGNESKRVVVIFRIDRQGKLEDVKVKESSGINVADQAALVAIRQTFPFRPLPREFSQQNIDIEFTFDYNVFGDPSRSRLQADNS